MADEGTKNSNRKGQRKEKKGGETTRISGGGSVTTIDYDANHERFREVNGSTVTYTFAGGLYEEIVEGTKTTQKAYVDGVILNTKVLNSGVEASNDTLYLHTDNLGSVEAISDKLGAFVSRMSFSDWGKRQQSDWKTGSPTGSFPTANGYTGHHQLDQHKLVHMGGRVYDPGLGRFLSADLFVQSPYSSQSFNRYSYVANNPLSNVDPTGYCTATTTTFSWNTKKVPNSNHSTTSMSMSGDCGGFTAADDYFQRAKEAGNSTVPKLDLFQKQRLYDEGEKLYGYVSSPERLNALFSDEADEIMEIVVTGCCRNARGTWLQSPVGGVTPSSVFGVERVCRMKCSTPHLGTDYPVGAGTEVVSTADGTVIFSGWMNGYGNTVVVDHGNNVKTLYAHNSSLSIAVNQTVRVGQLVALSGNSGGTSKKPYGNHSHYEIIQSTLGPSDAGFYKNSSIRHAPGELGSLLSN